MNRSKSRERRRSWISLGILKAMSANARKLGNRLRHRLSSAWGRFTAREDKEIRYIRLSADAVSQLAARCSGNPGISLSDAMPEALSDEERQLLARIRTERDELGRNNVTRTEAYLRVYRDRPELHWAFLAHMVSRNGGWAMTDLCGEFVPFLLDGEKRTWIFGFLERANALIFRDAYPQLLVYEASIKARRPLFHLLPELGVSRFMRLLWESHWEKPDVSLLTIGLIINEQHYIEERVVRNPAYRQHVISTVFFQAQALLQLNQMLLPHARTQACRLAGLTLERFTSLKERIEIGKQMYALLFAIPAVHEGAVRFAFARPHTGSRADYWPHLFAPAREEPPRLRGELQEKLDLDGIRLKAGARKLYSPALADVWPDWPAADPEPGDWFCDLSALDYLGDIPIPARYDLTQAYGSGLKKIELAVRAGELFR
ncbi:DUF2515 family protein [Paenibacillus puerhi]|uniref:DUF2515 family protein n=1 Tax=Paenibacillus puerhi TaxID=2692622 RepID=UPI001F28CF98|nr:DUF2515 family protein [Paenibacillus puerhi]